MSYVGFFGGAESFSAALSEVLGGDKINRIFPGYEADLTPDIEVDTLTYTVPVNRKLTILSIQGMSDGDCLWVVQVDGLTVQKKRNHHTGANVDLSFGAPYVMLSGQIITIKVTNLSKWGTHNTADTFIYAKEENV